jgi:hypothetical protein
VRHGGNSDKSVISTMVMQDVMGNNGNCCMFAMQKMHDN